MAPSVVQVSLLSYLAPERKTHVRTPRALIALATVALWTGTVTATAQAPTPRDPTKPCPGSENPLPGETCGDHYLESVRITLDRIRADLQGFSDSVDTSKATTQSDLFKPRGTRVGPPEPSTCAGARYGKTIWYDLAPEVDGDLIVAASGGTFNPVISLLRFDPADAPNFRPISAPECSNDESNTSEQLQKTRVRRGRAYSIQVGGVNNTGSPLNVDVNVVPYRLNVKTKPAYQLTPQGARLVGLRVSSNRKSRVEVRCSGCGRRVKRGRRVNFNLGGKRIRVGGRLVIRVTRGGEIGTYVSYRFRRGRRPVETERCLNPGSRTPRKTCG